MRAITRRPLSRSIYLKLAELQTDVQANASPRARAQTAWTNKPRRAFSEIRATLIAMAPGRSRCMYCEDSMGTDIDHFWPKAEYPHGVFCWHNYLLACSHCNSNEKRNQFPLDAAGAPLLIDPTAEDPSKHLLFVPSSGEFSDLDAKGRSTIEVFGLNDDAPPRRLATGRKRALDALKLLLVEYDRQVRAGEPSARETRAHITEYPFSSVLVWLLAVSVQPGAKEVLGAKLVRILARHRVAEWLD